MKSASGNQADSSCFGKIAVDYKKQIQVDSLIVADCAIYTEANIKLMSDLQWLSRVPLSIKSAQLLVSTLPESEFIESKLEGYSFVEKRVTYAGIEQRWLVVQSKARRESDLRKLSEKILKSEEKAKSELRKLSQDKFACEADAIKALSKLSKQFKYYKIEKTEVIKAKSNRQDEQQEVSYQISATISKDESKIKMEVLGAGRFIVATNILEPNELSNDSMISEYKAQQSCKARSWVASPGRLYVREDLVFLKTLYFSQIVFFLKVPRE